MNAPFMLRALALATENARLRRQNARLARDLAHVRSSWQTAADGWLRCALGWRDASVRADGWQARAVLLYELAGDQEYADELLATQAAIEALEEVDP